MYFMKYSYKAWFLLSGPAEVRFRIDRAVQSWTITAHADDCVALSQKLTTTIKVIQKLIYYAWL